MESVPISSSSRKGQLCYIVPRYTPDEASHMAHLPRFLSEVGKYCDVYVIVQRGSGHPKIRNVCSVYVQRPGNHLQRAIELIRVAYGLYRQGCHKFFVRISASAAFVLGLLGRVLGLQVYYWVSGQGKDMKPPWREGVRRRLHYELGDWLLRINIRLVHRFVTGPERMVDYFIREYGAHPDKTVVLYNDINTKTIKPLNRFNSKEKLRRALGLPANCPIVLFVGRVSPYKGGHYLIPIAHLLKQQLSDALLVVIGQVHIPNIIESAHQEGLDNLHFVGPVPNARAVLYYQAADVFILPSDSEGFPRVLLEAMACGLPIVAFNVGGVRDIVHPEQFPFVVPRGDVKGMVRKVAMLMADSALRSQQSKLGLRKVKQYSTEAVAKMFFERIVVD